MAYPSSQLFMLSLLLAMLFGHSSASWCVCKDGLSDTVLQKTLDYACGAGADCKPIGPTGACYNPPSVRSHCSFAVNSYFQKKPQATDSCDFGGTAALTMSNPSTNGCSFPASASSGSGTTPSTGVPSTAPTGTTPSTTTPVTGGSPTISGSPKTSSPYTTTVQPSTGTTTSPTTSSYPNGLSTGIAPNGPAMNDSHGEPTSPIHTAFCLLLTASASLMMLLLPN